MSKVKLTATIGDMIFTFDDYSRSWRRPMTGFPLSSIRANGKELESIQDAASLTLFDPLEIINTRCCALVQIKMPEHNGFRKRKLMSGIRKAKARGYRCVFVIQKESYEKSLGLLLKKTGFKKVHTYKRREAYDKTNLVMWIKNI